MASIDTNVLVRFLIKDDPRQHATAVKTINRLTKTEDIHIPVTVALELEWVLRSCYEIDKQGVIDVFSCLLETNGLTFHDEASIERALSLYSEHSADFADCLHIAQSITYESTPFYTFDKKAAKIPNAQLPS